MPPFTDETRRLIAEGVTGKVIESMEWVDYDGGYWVMTLDDGSESSLRFMAEIVE